MRPELTTTPTPENPHGYIDVLKKEYEVFNKNLDEFMEKHAGKYVLIKGDHIEGFYETRNEGEDVAAEKYAITGCYLLTKVTREKEVIHLPALTLGLMNGKI